MKHLLATIAAVVVALGQPVPIQAEGFDLSNQTKRSAKQWIRGRVVKSDDLEQYGLHLDKPVAAASGKPKADRDKNLVVLLHGFNSTPDRNLALLAPVREAHFPTATFRYPNDHSLAESARLLSTELTKYAQKHPKRKVTLVGHSMGGLVARAALEDPELDPGNVDQLIMVATPNHGTMLAHVTKGTDIWEHAIRHGSGGPIDRLRASVVDGLAEAVTDVKPGSTFLDELNGRERNPRVRYSLFLGTDGPVSPRSWTATRKVLKYGVRHVPYARKKVEKYDDVLADLDEVVDGRGDGVVAVKRGRLDGVDDTVVLRFSHLSVAGNAENDSIRTIQSQILARIEQN